MHSLMRRQFALKRDNIDYRKDSKQALTITVTVQLKNYYHLHDSVVDVVTTIIIVVV
jgi:hypothetical protein